VTTRSQARGQADAFMNNKGSVSFLPVGIAEASKFTELALVCCVTPPAAAAVGGGFLRL
jgi:hypothetical protein